MTVDKEAEEEGEAEERGKLWAVEGHSADGSGERGVQETGREDTQVKDVARTKKQSPHWSETNPNPNGKLQIFASATSVA